ncbi:lanthionine synthetase C family protein [Chitinophaga pinensis]|uniref:Lanthionine synthetase-like protein n=1 Tax=Chitinophaga pinensis TaxID=79329 RepID=A0A5C6LTT4_9BACT|nr:lanthionine synthetase C family protein [Chitinophaga pinensis]TWV99919.1 hypothetical protein FEF09_14595 [Chitinophaga pinensis]
MQQIAQKHLNKLNLLLENYRTTNDTFLKGKLGLIYYYSHLYKVTEAPALKCKTEDLIGEVFANINAGVPALMGASLSSGAAGFGYALNAMSLQGFLQFEVNDELESLDEFLYRSALDLIAADNFDFLHGALGVVHYFTERMHTSPQVAVYLDNLIEKICLNAVEEDGGYWFKNSQIKIDGEDVISFGLSHGQCGILLILLNAYAHSVHKELIRKIITGGIHFILKHKIDIDFSLNEYSFFPFIMKSDAREISAPNRMGWCYGDLNEVLLLYRAGKLFNDDNLLMLADLIGVQSMMRTDENATMVISSGFCHGAAGLAQFCKTLYDERGLDQYRKGYEYWIERTIILLEEELPQHIYAGKEGDVLEGAIGVAFTLLSYVSEHELNWSKAFLL